VRILHVVTLFERGGAQSVVLELSRAQASSGHAVAVMAAAGGAAWADLPGGVLAIPSARLRREIAPASDIAALLEIRRAIRRFEPDVVHLHSSKAGVLGRLASPRSRRRILYTVHGFDTILKAHRIFLPLERALSRACALVVAVSRYDLEGLRVAGVAKPELVYNGVSDFLRDPPHPSAEAREAMEAARRGGGFVVAAIARLAAPKRFDLFAAAARELGGEGFSFFWIGNQADPPGELPPNLTCLGDLPDARLLLRCADATCLLSDYEGLPMAAIESLCAGVPVVASSVGGIPEIVDASCGALVAKGVSPAAALRELVRDREILREKGKAARRRYEELFSAEAMAWAYARIYRRIAATRRPRGDDETV
jgi:glycosyltransferase involved in cell wall biosynthesis